MTKFVMPVVSFVEDYEPTTALGRKAEDNPFNETVAALILTWSDELKRSKGAAKLIIPAGETRTAVTQKFGASANAAGYSARYDDKANESFETGQTVEVDGEEVPETVSLGVLCAYLIPQITRKRKSKTVVVTNVADKSETDSPNGETVTPEVAEDQVVSVA